MFGKSQPSLLFASFLWLWISAPVTIASSPTEGQQIDDDESPACSARSSAGIDIEHQKLRMPDDCELVYAKVPSNFDSDKSEENQWGTYTMSRRMKGTPVRKHGDIIIQWTDPISESLKSKDVENWDQMLRRYTWDGQETGGHYEGQTTVESVVSGLGITARSTSVKNNNNILPLVPRVDDGSLTRFDSPGAGAVTRYHNLTWWFTKNLEAGDELIYSMEGKMPSSARPLLNETTERSNDYDNRPTSLTIEYLKTNGYCIDNMRPRKSRIKGAGRGAFATRDLLENSVVAPVPVALIRRDQLRKMNNNDEQKVFQLLLNYCFGHNSSSWLLFPYSPVVNLINHYSEPNVKLRWSTASNLNQRSTSTYISPKQTILLELVAIRRIKMGEEIYIDYGRDWEDSWWNHVRENWKPNNKHYTPSYVMDDAVQTIRTEQEVKEHPYPDNIFTSCFYRYSDRSEEEQVSARNSRSKESIMSFRWHLTKGLYDLKNLRPCRILKRIEDKSGRSVYAVRMLNRPGLSSDEIIPREELHIVTHIPRTAIRFSDKTGTTDQHLNNAFRHEIGLPEDLIPAAWRNENAEIQ